MSAAFLVLALRGIDLESVVRTLSGVRLLPLTLALGGVAAVFWVKIERWRYQLAPVKVVRVASSARGILIGFLANNVLPLRGGELVRAHILSRDEEVPFSTGLSTILAERLLDILALLTLTGAILIFGPLPPWLRGAVLVTGGIGLALVVGLVAAGVGRRLTATWRPRWFTRLPERVRTFVGEAADGVAIGISTLRGWRRFSTQFGFAVVETALWGAVAWACLAALGLEVSSVGVGTALLATNLAVMVPAAPLSVGVFEFAVLTALEFNGIERGAALAGALLIHAVFVVPACLAGVVVSLRTTVPRP